MIHGLFIQENIPVVRAVIAWGRSIQSPSFILDTGFTGDIVVTPKMAEELGLVVTGVTRTRFASGETVVTPTALALAAMEGIVDNVQVLILDSAPLLGISFLSKFSYKAIINCKHKTVVLERM